MKTTEIAEIILNHCGALINPHISLDSQITSYVFTDDSKALAQGLRGDCKAHATLHDHAPDLPYLDVKVDGNPDRVRVALTRLSDFGGSYRLGAVLAYGSDLAVCPCLRSA